MQDIKKLEAQYLSAKISYYEGNPTMTDAEFDALEQILIKEGSKVHEQVGSKRKDFDFPHPTRMLSLAKIQTEKDNNKYDEFYKWFSKRASIVGKMGMLYASPKFDGSAINIIYRNGNLESILTRGDGFYGKTITNRLKSHVPPVISEKGIVQIRCEVVIDVNVFKKKYADEFANARNFVAGILGKDEEDKEKLNDLTIIPLHYIVDGEHQTLDSRIFSEYPNVKTNWNTAFVYEDYGKVLKLIEKERESLNFQLDGMVISFPEQVRSELGENDHDPHWSVAIKFPAEEVVSEVVDIEWNISKRGELTPVVIMKPVQLMGSLVKRASAYNAGYIIKNKIKPGAIISLRKSGDIIPEILSVIYSPE
jgi:DNA ligase (NAD+)